ncbi:MAG: hypothetical protein HYW10_04120, partial [Candidatus Omnitrophica bacterium]|nr:hypothetical protein [Candidatus Omnitrophota bacterium]
MKSAHAPSKDKKARKKARQAWRMFWADVARALTAFVMVFQGVPLPFIPANAPAPLQVVKEVVEPQQAEAAQVKRVLRGTVAFTTTDIACLEPIGVGTCNSTSAGTAVDTGKSIILASNSSATDQPNAALIQVAWDDSSHLLMQRGDDGSSAASVEYMVVEFTSGVTVQSGTTVLSGATTTKTVTLPNAYTVGRAFPLVSIYTTTKTMTAAEHKIWVTATLQNGNQIKFDRNDSGATVSMFYQIVSFDADVEVNSGSVSVDGATGAGETNDTGTVVTVDNVTAGTDSKAINTRSMLFFTRAPKTTAAGIESRYEVTGEVGAGTNTDTTKLTFTRITNSGAVDVVWYLVEFKDNTFIDRINSQTSWTGTTGTHTIGSGGAESRRAFTVGSVAGGGTAAAGSYLDETLVRHQLNATSGTASAVNINRVGNSSVNVRGFVTEFPPLKLTQTADGGTGVLLKVGTQYNLTWEIPDYAATDSWDVGLSQDSGGSYLNAALSCTPSVSGNTVTCPWTVPDSIPTTPTATNPIDSEARLKTTDTTIKGAAGDTTACAGTSTVAARHCDASNADFKIRGQLAITEPDGSAPLGLGATTIKWKYCGQMGNCKLSKSVNGAAFVDIATVACGTAACTSWATAPVISPGYSWTPDPSDASENVVLKIEDIDDGNGVPFDNTSGLSNTLAIRPSITVEKPISNAGTPGTSQWPTGRCRVIQWTTTGNVPTVDILWRNVGG